MRKKTPQTLAQLSSTYLTECEEVRKCWFLNLVYFSFSLRLMSNTSSSILEPVKDKHVI